MIFWPQSHVTIVKINNKFRFQSKYSFSESRINGATSTSFDVRRIKTREIFRKNIFLNKKKLWVGSCFDSVKKIVRYFVFIFGVCFETSRQKARRLSLISRGIKGTDSSWDFLSSRPQHSPGLISFPALSSRTLYYLWRDAFPFCFLLRPLLGYIIVQIKLLFLSRAATSLWKAQEYIFHIDAPTTQILQLIRAWKFNAHREPHPFLLDPVNQMSRPQHLDSCDKFARLVSQGKVKLVRGIFITLEIFSSRHQLESQKLHQIALWIRVYRCREFLLLK